MRNAECGMGPLGGLFTDLYELTMLAGYYHHHKQDEAAVFEYFFRKLPANSGYAVFAGLDNFLDDLVNLHFSNSDIEYLDNIGLFDNDFLDYLQHLRFAGDVWAPLEGTPVFPYEPIVRVHAPLGQAQLIETLLLCRLNYSTLIATKAARIKYAAENDSVLEFGLRRAQGPDGGMTGSRASIIGGCDSTSNSSAGKCFNVRAVGTQAHSWIMAFPSELDAFRAYAQVFPDHLILLVDTYDTLSSGVPNAIKVFNELREEGWTGRPGIRIDSGDLAMLSKKAYEMLCDAGFDDALIVASSELDEYLIADIKRQGAKINQWGVGTKLMTGGSEPALGGVYKLAAICKDNVWLPKMKISDNPAKTTDPGIKMPVRFIDTDGFIAGDVIFEEDDKRWESGEVHSLDRTIIGQRLVFPDNYKRYPLLQKVIDNGKRMYPEKAVIDIRSYAIEMITGIPGETRRLVNPQIYWVGLSDRLTEKKHQAIDRFWHEHTKTDTK
ncbi:MAG: nicotinate phosphoribosyltransferase [Armatimonadota bacterium]